MRFRDGLREPQLWAACAAAVLFFWRPLTTSTFFFRDLYQLFYPKKLFFAESLRNGHLPLWDPLTNGGQAFLANPANTAFHPLNALFLFLSPLTAFNVLIVLEFVLCAAGAYLLARSQQLTPRASLVASLVYTFCGFTLSTANLLPIALALPWIPLTICFADAALRTSRWKYLALASLSAAMPLISAAAETEIALFVILTAWFAARSAVAFRTRLGMFVFIAFFAVALSLVQTFPAIGVVGESSRSGERSYRAFTMWSVDARRLPELVIPQFFGETDKLDDRDYWGRVHEDTGFPYVLSIYFGALALLLAAAPFLNRKQVRNSLVPRRILGALAISGILLSLGRSLLFFPLLYRWVPLITTFRYPVKALLLALLPVALLAGDGFDALFGEEEETMRKWRRLVASGAASSIALAVLYSVSDAFGASFAKLFFSAPLDDARRAALSGKLWQPALVLLAASLFLFLLRTRQRDIAASLLVALVASDLMVAGSHVNTFVSRDFFRQSSLASAVKRIAGDGRFYHAPDPSDLSLRAPSNDIAWLSRWKLQTLSGYSSIAFGIPAVYHVDFDGLAPQRMAILSRLVPQLPWQHRITLLGLADVRAFIAFVPLVDARIVTIGRVRTEESHPMFLYSVPSAAAARFVSSAKIAASQSDALRLVTTEEDANRVIVEEKVPPGGDCGVAAVRTFKPTPERSEYDVSAPCDGFVTFAEPFYPEWHATVDGTSATLVRADYAFSAIAVRRGAHHITRTYEPRFPLYGAIASLTALISLGLIAIVVTRRREQ